MWPEFDLNIFNDHTICNRGDQSKTEICNPQKEIRQLEKRLFRMFFMIDVYLTIFNGGYILLLRHKFVAVEVN